MSERDELAEVIAWRQHAANPRPTVLDGAVADAILAAGYRKPRTITTTKELDALPGGVLVVTEQGGYWESIKRADGLNWWIEPGARSSVSASSDLTLPATVLYEPAT